MKFSIVKTDKKKVLHHSAKTAEWFFNRIMSDTKACDIGRLRTHIANVGDNGNFESMNPIAMIHPTAELVKTENGNLEIKSFNGLVTLHVAQLMRREDIDDVKEASKMLPMTFAAFTGADGRSVEILVAVATKGNTPLRGEAEIDAFCQTAYEAAFGAYSGILPKPIERQKATARSCFRMTLDSHPYYHPQATPLEVKADSMPSQQTRQSGEYREELREMDFTLYGDYELLYTQAVEEAYNDAADVVESQRKEAFITELAHRLCSKGVPEEEAFLHIHNHNVFHKDYDKTTTRAIVEAVYAEEHPRRQKETETVSRQMRRLIRFLTTRYVFRYNTVMGYPEFRPNNTWVQDWQPCDEQAINGLSIEARLSNLDVRDKDVRRYVRSNMIRPCDPIGDYLAKVSGKWDGKTDHIAMLARCVPCDIPQWETWFKKWFVSMVAQWMHHTQEYGNSIVPLLISSQGDGKTTFCRMILPKELSWGFLENLDVSEKRQTLQSMHNFLLINLDEFNQIAPKLQEGFLKNIISLPSVKIKRPYGKHVEEFHRYASFIATTNETNVLVDPTGNRRFICVSLTAPIRTDYKPNYEALYAQAYQLVMNHEMRWWFTADEVKEVIAHNHAFEVTPPAIQYFHEYYEPAETTNDGGKWLSPTAIYESLRQIAGAGLKANGVAVFGRYLQNMPGLQQRRIGGCKQYLVRKKAEK